MFVIVPVPAVPHEITMVGVPVSVSCDWKKTVMTLPDAAYQVFVALFELNVVVQVRIGVSLSMFIITDVFVVSVLLSLSME